MMEGYLSKQRVDLAAGYTDHMWSKLRQNQVDDGLDQDVHTRDQSEPIASAGGPGEDARRGRQKKSQSLRKREKKRKEKARQRELLERDNLPV